MNKFGDRVRQLREEHNLLQRHIAAELDIDPPLLSKIERGERRAKRDQVIGLAKLFKTDRKELLTLWLADQVYKIVQDESEARNALKVAESEINYKTKNRK